MTVSNSLRVGAGLASILLLAHCTSEDPTPASKQCASPGDPSCSASGGSGAGGNPSGGVTSNGGTPSTAGTPSGGGSSATGGSTATGGSLATGGAIATGGTAGAGGAISTGGASAAGGAIATGGSFATGGSTDMGGMPSGGTSGGAGMAGSSLTGGSGGAAGSNASGGNGGTSGASATGGKAGAGGGAEVDQNGVPIAKPGDSKNQSRAYLNLGDMRLVANKWGSDELGCNTSLRVFANTDRTLGWDFDRGACGGNKEKPDYPEIEFGIHPFGAGNSLATTPSFSSTSVLPIQIKNITTASVVLDNLAINIQRASTYNLNFEFWLSQRNPVTDSNPGVYAELITFFSWQDSWACDKSGSVQAGDKGFGLCHQDDAWAGGKWRYYQFRLNGGSTNSVSGRIDVKALLDWLVSNAGYSRELWVTRFEIGSEIDDDTKGTVTLRNVTFEVNGTSKTPRFGQ